MKSRLFLVLFFSASFLFSCSKHDTVSPDDSSLIGQWKMTGLTYRGTSTTTIEGVTQTANFNGTGVDMDMHIRFTRDPNNFTSQGNYSIQGSASMEGESYPFSFTENNFVGNGTWKLDGKRITVTKTDGSSSVVTIAKLKDDSLTVLFGDDQTVDQQGQSVQLSIEGSYDFVRE